MHPPGPVTADPARVWPRRPCVSTAELMSSRACGGGVGSRQGVWQAQAQVATPNTLHSTLEVSASGILRATGPLPIHPQTRCWHLVFQGEHAVGMVRQAGEGEQGVVGRGHHIVVLASGWGSAACSGMYLLQARFCFASDAMLGLAGTWHILMHATESMQRAEGGGTASTGMAHRAGVHSRSHTREGNTEVAKRRALG